MGKLVPIVILLIVAVPPAYLGLMYVSATSARFTVSSIGLKGVLDPIQALLSRQLDIEIYLNVEGHGLLPVPVKTLKGQIYFEDVYIGSVSSSEPFIIQPSGKTTAHLTFNLNLAAVSLEDIQKVISSISSHNGEVKIGFDGYTELVILFFPITIPVSHSVYSLTISDAPKVTLMQWDTTSASVGDSVGFTVTVQNPFRGSAVDGVLDILVREDVILSSDVNAMVHHFTVHLSPGQSGTYSGSFEPYKGKSTRGFFLKAQWGVTILAEQPSTYPPRLSVTGGTLSLVNVYWTIGNSVVQTCEVGKEVSAHMIVKASNTLQDTITVRIRKDIVALPDKDFMVTDFILSLNKYETEDCIVRFTPDEPSGSILRGYFVEIEGALSWTMESAYPPRLRVTAEAIPQATSAWWTTSNGVVTEAQKGETIQGHIKIKALNGDITGSVTFRVRKDLVLLPDKDHKVQAYSISLKENQETELIIEFTASEPSSSTFRGYFIEVDFSSWSTSWTMESAYPPRLKVNEAQTSVGLPAIQNVWWTVNDQTTTQAQQGQTVTAHVRVKAGGGRIEGSITVRIRRDLVLLPDDDYKVQTFSISLSQDQVQELIVTFTAADKSSLTFRGFFVQVDLASWGQTWTMASSYPPRLKVI